MEKKVSVIIPCYNQGQYIYETINSVLEQTYNNIEIVIVNDGSTDEKTIEILNEINDRYSNINILNTKNHGLATARNNGIRVSTGEYILPLDSDDKIEKSYIEKAVKILNDNIDIGVVYSFVEFFGERKGLFLQEDFDEYGMLLNNVVCCTAMFRREDYDKTNGYNPNMKFGNEDWDFWLTMIENKVKFYRINEVMFYYRYKKQSMREELRKKKELMFSQIVRNHSNLYNENLEKIISQKIINNRNLIDKINDKFRRLNLKVKYTRLLKNRLY